MSACVTFPDSKSKTFECMYIVVKSHKRYISLPTTYLPYIHLDPFKKAMPYILKKNYNQG